MSSNGKRFYGKYRGIVQDNEDPLMQGRIQATVPDVMGEGASGWAMPAAPFGGNQMGFLGIPSVGAGVWIEFEHGDPDYPIWSGAWWGSSSELPSDLLPAASYKVVLQSNFGHKIIVDDTPGVGGITLETVTGQKISLTATGIVIDNGMGGKIELQGPQVSVNDGALEVI